jgi:hypothetical protein
LWALPLINTLGMKVGSEKTFGARYNALPVWKKRLDAKTLVTTPNSDVIYVMGYLDLGKDGSMVFEVPPGLQGILLDFWQRPIPGPTIGGHAFFGDVGFFGPDEAALDKSWKPGDIEKNQLRGTVMWQSSISLFVSLIAARQQARFLSACWTELEPQGA